MYVDSPVLSPKRVRAFAAARRHARLVAFLKFVIPLFLCLTFLMSLKLFLHNSLAARGSKVDFLQNEDQSGMLNPTLTGSRGDRDYVIVAEEAAKDPRNTDNVLLDVIEGRLDFADKNWMRLQTSSGTFSTIKQALSLPSVVDMSTSGGYDIKLKGLDVDFEEDLLRSQGAVRIASQKMSLDADELEIKENATHFIFRKNVKMTLYPSKGVTQ